MSEGDVKVDMLGDETNLVINRDSKVKKWTCLRFHPVHGRQYLQVSGGWATTCEKGWFNSLRTVLKELNRPRSYFKD